MRQIRHAAAPLLYLTLFASLAVGDDSTPAEAPAIKKVAVLKLQGSMPEAASPMGLFGDMQASLSDVTGRLNRAAKDKDISAVLLRIRDLSVGRGKLHELRTAVAQVRAAGKKVFAEFESASSVDYLVACACDEITMPARFALSIDPLGSIPT